MRSERAPTRCLSWLHRLAALAAIIAPAVGFSSAQAGPAREAASPVILVHGIAWDLGANDATWGRWDGSGGKSCGWSGMIGALVANGLTYGGEIHPNGADVSLPERLDAAGACADPRRADLFVLKFSKAANTDGVAYKALELAESIKEVCRLTGAKKVRLVAHSAGGLVARVYLQNALPGVRYRGDVERLITIATPHLGSATAEHWGDFLGTRATSIKPTAALIRNLNDTLDLPEDVTFAAIVVRGIAADDRGRGKEFNDLVNHTLLDALPVEYRLGGDQVVHVRSQNLRLAACAARYEKKTGRPIQYVLARVADPTPGGWHLRDLTDVRVHVIAPYDPTVQDLVCGLLNEKAVLWKRSTPEKLAGWYDWQARVHANGIVESQAMGKHPCSSVSNVKLEDFQLVSTDGLCRHYRFNGEAWSTNVAIPFRKRWTHVRGTVALTFDAFGRVLAETTNVEERRDG